MAQELPAGDEFFNTRTQAAVLNSEEPIRNTHGPDRNPSQKLLKKERLARLDGKRGQCQKLSLHNTRLISDVPVALDVLNVMALGAVALDTVALDVEALDAVVVAVVAMTVAVAILDGAEDLDQPTNPRWLRGSLEDNLSLLHLTAWLGTLLITATLPVHYSTSSRRMGTCR